MKYAFNVALVTLAAAVPIADLSRQPAGEEIFSKRQGNLIVKVEQQNTDLVQ